MKLKKNKTKLTITNYFFKVMEIKHFYTLFMIFILLASLLFCYLYIEKFNYIVDDYNNLVFKKIAFGHGPLIHNLIFNNVYQGEFLDRIYIIQKLPTLPILIYLLSFISHNFYFIIIAKNLLLFSILIFFLFKYLNSNKIDIKNIYIYLIAYLIPYNMFVTLNFEYADSIIAILLPSLLLVLLSQDKHKYLYSSFLLFFLYLTKNSTLFLCILVPIYIILFEKKNKYKSQKYLILIGPLLAMVIWASFSYFKTGRLAYGSNILSVNSLGMDIVLNKDFSNYFPDKSLDLIHSKNEYPNNITDEWELSDHYKNKNYIYLSEKKNLFDYLSNFPKKILFIFFNIRKDALHPDINGNFDNSIRYSQIPNKIFFNIAIILSITIIIKKFLKRNLHIYDDFMFLFVVGTYILPFVLAWSTSKHLVPVAIISYIYVFHTYFFNKKIFF